MKGDHWPAAMVAHLQRSQRLGVAFEAAWLAALRANIPDGKGSAETLFDERGEPHDTAVAFLKRVTRDAYNGVTGPIGSGRGPALRSFRPEMLRELDSSEPARRIRRLAA